MARKRPKRVSFDLKTEPQARSGDFDELFATDGDSARASALQLREITLTAIEADPSQPRTIFVDDALQALSQSISENGVIQPIEVIQTGPNSYRIVHGERRWRAAKLAGLTTMPAIVQRREYDEVTRFVRQLVENIQREDLNDIDRAAGLVRLRDMLQTELNAEDEMEGNAPWSRRITWAKVGAKLGYSRQRIHQLIQLLKLPDEIKQDLRDGRLSERDTRIYQGLNERQQQNLYEAWRNDQVSTAEAKKIAAVLKSGRTASVSQATIMVQTGQSVGPKAPPTSPVQKLERIYKQLVKVDVSGLDSAESVIAHDILEALQYDIDQMMANLRRN
jgi:ParB family chromosome partitioning protein